jgi:hypothetical protein
MGEMLERGFKEVLNIRGTRVHHAKISYQR